MTRILLILYILHVGFPAFADDVVFATEEDLSAFDQMVMKQVQKNPKSKIQQDNLQKELRTEQNSVNTAASVARDQKLNKGKKSGPGTSTSGHGKKGKSKK